MASTITRVDLPKKPLVGFLKLPQEVRDRIYYLVLVEPSKWEKRHKANCPYGPRDSYSIECPPVMIQGTSSCSCAKRLGLGLLATNRQIHAEAALWFWPNNTFVFLSASDFVEDVGKCLREDYRRLIRRVSIWPTVSVHWRRDLAAGARSQPLPLIWPTLRDCSGIQTLEIQLERTIPDLEEIDSLPNLCQLRFAETFCYDVAIPGPEGRQTDNLYIRVVKEIPFKDNWSFEEAMSSFKPRFLNYAQFAIETVLFGQRPEVFERGLVEGEEWVLPVTLNDCSGPQILKTSDGREVVIWVLGLPLSRKASIEHQSNTGEELLSSFRGG